MKLFSFTGASGIGKDYLKRIALRRFPFLQELMWFTTRPLRDNEKSSGNRRTVSRDDFLKLKQEKHLALTQELGETWYGLEVRPLLDGKTSDGFFLTELHVDNLCRIENELGIIPTSIGLFPSNVDFLRYRLEKRKSETATEVERRLAASVREIEKMESMRTHFALTLTISKSNEDHVHHDLLSFLNSQIQNPL